MAHPRPLVANVGKLFIAIGLLASSVTGSQAAILVNYTFTGSSPGNANSSDSDANSVASAFSAAGFGAISSTTGTYFVAPVETAGTEALAITGNDFVSFSLTVDANYSADLSSLTFDTAYNGQDPAAAVTSFYFVRSSLDGFASNIGTTFSQAYTSGAPATTGIVSRSVDLSGPLFQNLPSGTPITFRIYIYDQTSVAVSPNKVQRLDNVILNGDIVAVPEPSSVGLLGLAGLGLFLNRRRRIS